ncbi:hypothetical protein [Azospira oryzae]|uniref:hypothetical protein n=1 Tax=Azospira oryzae TaxID=146939 RepID=UPI0019651A6D|nr:hypothetical protein [Azospira oryzae]
MTSNRTLSHCQSGVSIIAALFLLLLFASLAIYMLWITSSMHRGVTQDVLGAQAYQAARSGAEWGLYRLLRDGQCAGETPVVFSGSGLMNFTASVTCRATANTKELDSSTSVKVYEIESIACNHPVGGSCRSIAANGADYVERQVRVTTECMVDNGIPAACP